MTRRNLKVAILKFLEERKNLAFNRYDVAEYFDNISMKEIIFSLYELKRVGKVESYKYNNESYYLWRKPK